jgi:CHASE3 domain sensor protein
MPATNSAVPVSGSVGTTFALLLGGFFFITAGMWSYWLSREYNAASNETDTL